MSKRRRAEAVMGPPEAAEEFMALLLWAQTSECGCPAATYFKKMGRRLVKQHITEAEEGG